MANFDLNSYETVEQRHARAIEAHPDLRSVMVNHTTPADRAQGMWVVESRVYLTAEDQMADLPKATEWAFEIDGQGMANKTSALENAATSSLGRALRWALGGSKGPSREEMAKAQRGQTPKAPPVEWRAEIEAAKDVDELMAIHARAALGGYTSTDLMSALSARKEVLK
jgi:hypothetical protein